MNIQGDLKFVTGKQSEAKMNFPSNTLFYAEDTEKTFLITSNSIIEVGSSDAGWRGVTQTEFDAIPTKNPEMLYIIKPV